MDKNEMQKMMQTMCAKMSSDEKSEMMMGMMGKMKEGMTKEEAIAETSPMECPGDMKEMMAKMMQEGEEHESTMPEMMLKGMMPHCIKMMMPAISKDERADLVSNMISTLMEQASTGMSDEEKTSFTTKVVETMNTQVS